MQKLKSVVALEQANVAESDTAEQQIRAIQVFLEEAGQAGVTPEGAVAASH